GGQPRIAHGGKRIILGYILRPNKPAPLPPAPAGRPTSRCRNSPKSKPLVKASPRSSSEGGSPPCTYTTGVCDGRFLRRCQNASRGARSTPSIDAASPC